MPKLVELKTNFVAGEFDPLLLSRSDIKHYFNAAEYLRNVIVLPQGGVRSRPGSRYLWKVPEIPGGGLSVVRMFEFQFSTDQTYLFVFHHLSLTIFRAGAVVATIVTPYASSQLRAVLTTEGDLISTGLSVTQSRDTMIVFHQDFAPRVIKRGGSHAIWTIGVYDIKNVAIFDFGDTVYVNGVNEVQTINFPNPGDQGNWVVGDTFKLSLEDEETDNISFNATAATMAANIQAALRALANVDATGIAVVASVSTNTVDATFTVSFTNGNGQRPWGALSYETISTKQVPSIDIIVTIKGVRPGENVWSDTRGWPRCGVFFQGRLWVAGTRSLPNTLWSTRAGSYVDFNSKKIDDDYGISATTDTDDIPAFCVIFAGRHLQLFSTAAEFYIPASESDAVTPGNIVLRRTTSRGIKAGLRVYEVDGATLFVQRRGKALREMIFADVELAYQSNNVSLLASHLMRDPVGYALRRSSSTDDADYMFLPNIDGTMTVFCTLRTQDVNAMTLWETKGLYDDVAVVLDKVYFSVVRQINGTAQKFIEVMDETITVDCAAANDDLGAPLASVTLAHLPNTMIEHQLDGFVQPAIQSSGAGLVTFARSAANSYAAGIRYPDVLPDLYPGLIWAIRTLPIEVQLPDGASLGKKRRIVRLTLRLYSTAALYVNGNQISFQQFGSQLLDQPPPSFTGIKNIRGLLGWDFQGQVVVGSDISTKATLLGLAWAVSI